MARKLESAKRRDRASAVIGDVPDAPDPDHILLSLLRIIGVWDDPAYRAALVSGEGMPPDTESALALLFLIQNGPMRPTELSELLHKSAPATSRFIDKLAEERLVVRLADPDDARSSLVSIDRAGAGAAVRMYERGDAVREEFLADFAPDEVAQLLPLLQRLAGTIERHAHRITEKR